MPLVPPQIFATGAKCHRNLPLKNTVFKWVLASIYPSGKGIFPSKWQKIKYQGRFTVKVAPGSETLISCPGSVAIFPLNLNIYRLITVYLLKQVNCDKIMHVRWDFDVSNARTQRVCALDKHENWSESALFCYNSWTKSKYAIHTWHK